MRKFSESASECVSEINLKPKNLITAMHKRDRSTARVGLVFRLKLISSTKRAIGDGESAAKRMCKHAASYRVGGGENPALDLGRRGEPKFRRSGGA
jgi:hypothetical protein